MSWAVEECSRQCLENSGENKRKVLGDALFLIRFPTMPLREFANSAARARVLTAEEKCSVFEYLTCERTEVRAYYLTRARLEPASDLGKAFLGNWVWGQFGVCPQLFRETSRLIVVSSAFSKSVRKKIDHSQH